MSNEFVWEAEATEAFETIMAEIPFLMRGQVRQATLKQVEAQARENQASSISRDDVLIALIRITPKGMRDGLKAKFHQFGVDPAPYASHFDA